jgi:eukaryotic-like serine/threonine-protein kinase
LGTAADAAPSAACSAVCSNVELPVPGTEPLEIVGRYALHEPIAKGGTASVHFGRLLGQRGFARTAAIKRLHPQFSRDPSAVAQLIDEARVSARIRHPNVISTLDVVTAGDEVLVVMEYVRGVSLAHLLHEARQFVAPVPPAVAASVLVGVLSGLHAAHEVKDEHGLPLAVVHRELSPHNVLVGADGVARVLDFGIAQAQAQRDLSQSGPIQGRLGYRSPEQLRGEGVDRRADVYAAGVLLWEALAGKPLFAGDDAGALLGRILEQPIPAPSSVASSTSAALDRVVLRALALDPDERYATAREFALDLASVVELAVPNQVSAWVEALAGDVLRQRDHKVSAIESYRPPEPPPALEQAVEPPVLEPSRAELAAAVVPPVELLPGLARRNSGGVNRRLIGAVLLCGVVAVAALIGRGQRDSTPTSAAAPLTEAPRSLDVDTALSRTVSRSATSGSATSGAGASADRKDPDWDKKRTVAPSVRTETKAAPATSAGQAPSPSKLAAAPSPSAARPAASSADKAKAPVAVSPRKRASLVDDLPAARLLD